VVIIEHHQVKLVGIEVFLLIHIMAFLPVHTVAFAHMLAVANFRTWVVADVTRPSSY